MRVEGLNIALRRRPPWEATDLGVALVRRHLRAIIVPWLVVSGIAFIALNVLLLPFDLGWLALLLLWWLKPLFDRVPVYVLARAIMGEVPSVRTTLRAQWRDAWRPILPWLLWRRLHPSRSMLLPVDLLEGLRGPARGERVRVLSRGEGATPGLLWLIGFWIGVMLWASIILFGLMLVPSEFLSDTAKALMDTLLEQPPWWIQLLAITLYWLVLMVVEPIYVGAGFALYLNRRTQLEAWDVEIAFRKMRARLAAAAPLLVVLALLGAGASPAHAQQREPAPAPAASRVQERDLPPTLPLVFGDARVDESRFNKAVGQAYRDPLLDAKRTQVTWEKRNKAKPRDAKPRDLSWLAGFGKAVAFIAEWGLWILAGGLVVLLLATARHWLPWMRGSLRRHKPLPPRVETEVLELPESLPDNVPAEARRLWSQGKPRHALALLYRASVESMASRAEVALPPGATESECLRASRRMPDEEDRRLFARMVRVWQYAAYARQLPAQAEFDELLAHLQRRYRWLA